MTSWAFANGLQGLGVSAGGIGGKRRVGYAENFLHVFRHFLGHGIVLAKDGPCRLAAQPGADLLGGLAKLQGGLTQFSVPVFRYDYDFTHFMNLLYYLGYIFQFVNKSRRRGSRVAGDDLRLVLRYRDEHPDELGL